jgi:hypothetical protein
MKDEIFKELISFNEDNDLANIIFANMFKESTLLIEWGCWVKSQSQDIEKRIFLTRLLI